MQKYLDILQKRADRLTIGTLLFIIKNDRTLTKSEYDELMRELSNARDMLNVV